MGDSGVVDEILAEFEAELTLQEWLKLNPEADAVFWEVIQRGYVEPAKKGVRCNVKGLVDAFVNRYPTAPKPTTNTKRWVDIQIAERSQRDT